MFRAYYSQKLGSEGMGIFSLTSSVHSIMLTFATGGLGVAVSKIISEHYSHHCYAGIKKAMSIALFSVLVLSTIIISSTFLFSEQIAVFLLKEPRCETSLLYLSPSILFMGLSYCIKGYFYASRRILYPSSSEFLEQAIKIISIRFLLSRWLPNGIEHGCEAVFLGITISEFSSCFYLMLFYFFDCRKLQNGIAPQGILKSITSVALPAMTTSLMSSSLRMQENVWIVTGLEKSGLSHAQALSEYGTIHGMIMPLIVFPLTLFSSCFSLLVPEISRANNMVSRIRLQTLISRIYRFTIFLGFMIACVLITFSSEFSLFIYNAPQISISLRTLAFLCPIMLMDSVSCGMLNGLGKQSFLLGCNLTDSALRLILIFGLLPIFGKKSLIIIIIVSNIMTFTLTTRKVRNHANLKSEGFIKLILPGISVFISYFIVYNIFNLVVTSITLSSVIFGIISVVLIYSAFCYISGAFSKNDASWLISRIFLSH